MRPEVRPELLQIADVPHGALDFAELECLGMAPQDVLDFSVNGNPYGPSPLMQAVLAQVPLDRYPDREALALRRALAAHLDVSLASIVVGNGSVELMWLIALAFLRPHDAVVILGPTFGEYRRAAAIMGAQIHDCTALAAEAFQMQPTVVQQTLQRLTPRVVFVCNPNNPTGTYLPVNTIVAWAEALPQTLFVVDEAYLPFAPGATSVLTTPRPNLLVLRSMTKAQALAGVRLGYAVGPAEVIRALTLVHPPWNVNALAQAAGIVALQDQAHLTDALTRLAQARETLLQELHALGLAVVPSCTHFFLLRVGEATAWRTALLQHGILVRDCTSFGLPEYIRIATRRPEENARLLAALAQVR
jgi:L-threonine-O-3-phosphate decarboxylase